MDLRILVLMVLFPLAFVQLDSGRTVAAKSADCSVTIPRTTPDSLRNALGTTKAYWNENLYVASLWDSIVVIRPQGPGSFHPDGSMEMKYPWFRAAGLTGKLTITGKRLDATAPPLKADIPSGYSDTGFQATGLIFPTEGCWEITGKVGDTSLTFVNRVIRGD